jgi:diguanylate cyclase (GGDEF)-like protein
MGLVDKLIGSDGSSGDDAGNRAQALDELTDEALDTLGSFLRIYGSQSFAIEDEMTPEIFDELCRQFAAHVENGAAIPAFDIDRCGNGGRDWPRVRSFFADRRRAEKSFVTGRLDDYRGVVEDLLRGLRLIGERNQGMAERVTASLNAVENAVTGGGPQEIRAAIARAVEDVTAAFAEQEREYQEQLSALNDRMQNLRQDLSAVREEMQRDALTEVYNRGAFDAAIRQSLNVHFILNQDVTVILLDVDNFKAINDSYGHAAGDEALRAIGGCLERAFIRKGDLVARFGGDEFAVILNDTSAANSARLIQRFLDSLSRIELGGDAAAARITCSAGYTEIHASDTAQTLLARADAALYAAKAAGRDRAELRLAPEPSC